MDPTIGSLVSVGIGAIVTLLGVFLSNWLLVRKEREQWRQERKAEQEEWLRDKLQEIYSSCIYYLGRVATSEFPPGFDAYSIQYESKVEYERLKLEYGQLELGYKQLEFERRKVEAEYNNEKRRWLNLLAVYHPFRGTTEFDSFLEKIREHKLRITDITDLAARDPRVQGHIGKQGASASSPRR